MIEYESEIHFECEECGDVTNRQKESIEVNICDDCYEWYYVR